MWKKKIKIYAPVKGELINLTNEEMEQHGLIGYGFGIIPETGIVIPPSKGMLGKITPNKNTFVINHRHIQMVLHLVDDHLISNPKLFETRFRDYERIGLYDPLVIFNLEEFRKTIPDQYLSLTFININKDQLKILKTGKIEHGEHIADIYLK